MIFLPNKTERYTAALRIIIQHLSIKNGINTKYLKNLKKIYIAEAILNPDYEQPINIYDYIYKIFESIHIVKTEKTKPFFYKINVRGTFLIKEKLFSSLLLSLCEITDCIEVSYKKGNLIIKCKTEKTKHCALLIKKLKGSVLYEIKSNYLLMRIPVTLTDKKTIGLNFSIEDYILNPLSPINIFIH